MDDQHSKRIITALIAFGVFIMVLILALALLIALAFTNTNNAIHKLEDRLKQTESFKPVDTDKLLEQLATRLPIPQNGKDGQTIVGPPGKDGASGNNGKDGQVDYEAIAAFIKQTFDAMPKPRNGLDGTSARKIEFDGFGHWRYVNDDEWLPLFQEKE